MGPQEKIFRSHRSTLRVTLNVAQPNSPSPNLRFFMHAAKSIEGGVGLMMVGVAPPMVTNPPDGVMALSAGRLHTKPAPRASPATHGAPKAPIGTHPTPHPTPRGAIRTPIWPWPRRMRGSAAEKTLETLCYKSSKGPGNGRVWYLAPGNRCVYRRFLALKTT